ncbi:MAG: hypothetical protein ACOX4C_08925 [Bacillota bacterium]
MLNELSRLSERLEEAGIQPVSWHPDFKPCPKYRTYYLFVSSNGVIQGATRIADLSEITALRKYERANGLSFPAFNVFPVASVQSADARATLERTEMLLKSTNVDVEELERLLHLLMEESEPLWGESDTAKLKTCLLDVPLELSKKIGEAPSVFMAWNSLIAASLKLSERIDDIPDMLIDILLSLARGEPGAALEFLGDTLATTAANGKDKRVSVVLEIANRLSFDRPANHPETREWVNQRLIDVSNADAGSSKVSTDAFGSVYSITDDEAKFPAARLPILGNVILRAMSHESPCQRRYGRVNAASFPMGVDMRQDLKNALEWVGAKDRRGQTWQDVSDVCGGKAGVLFAYPETLPNLQVESAGIFAGVVSGDQEATFSAVAQRVVGSLQLLVRDMPDAQVTVFVLMKIDKARTKVLMSRRLQAEALMDSARAWRDGCQNIPRVFLRMLDRKDGRRLQAEVPFPTDVARMLKTEWNMDCGRSTVSRSGELQDAFDLFIGGEDEERAAAVKVLDFMTLKGVWPLLALGHADHLDRELAGPILNHRRIVSLMPAALGLCLSKLGIERRDYMRSTPFLVGKMLAMADLLHKEYCLDVRKGSIPTQLVGNALMPTALENPQQALARLSDRIYVYKSWVDKSYSSNEPGEKYALARWAVKQMGLVSQELSERRITTQTNEADKAQMLLGYLSRETRSDKDELGAEFEDSYGEVV